MVWLSLLVVERPALGQVSEATDDPFATAPWRGSAGVGVAVAFDVADRGAPAATLGPGFSLTVPLRFSVAPAAAIRVTPRLEAVLGGGERPEGSSCGALDQLSWQVTPDVRTAAQSACGWMFAAGATAGPEIRWPLDGPVQPYLAGGLGLLGALVTNRIDREELTVGDPTRTSIDGWSLAAGWLTDVHLGALVGTRRQWFLEAGYAVAWVPRSRVRRTVEALDVAREPFAYNAFRLSTGITWSW